MTASDASAATAAWLARLPAGERAAAQAHTDLRLAGWIAVAVAVVAACALLARSGVIRRLTARLEAERPQPWLASAVAAGLTATALALAKAPADAWAAWRLDAGPSTFLPHLTAALGDVLPTLCVALALVPPLIWLIRVRPRSWPILAGGTLTAAALALGWLPFVLSAGPHLTPAPPSPARDGVAQLIAQAQLPAGVVQLDPDLGLDANVTGGFGRASVSLGPLLLAGPADQARAYVAHVAGHYVNHDILIVTLVWSGVIALGFAAMAAWAAPLARVMNGRPVAGPADPAALPALALIGLIAFAGAGLAASAYLRWANVRADDYSLSQAREPDGLAAVLEQEWSASQDRDGVAPSAVETALFYTHPPLAGRIAHAMAWKRAHGG